jgi:hypothetical protein
MKKHDRHSVRTSTCRACGLRLEISCHAEGVEISYDFADWEERCRLPELGGPSLCLGQALAPSPTVVEPGLERRDEPLVRATG